MDPISDLLNRIKNAQRAGQEETEIPFSKVKFELAKILAKEGFLESLEKKGQKGKERILVRLKYNQGTGAIQEIKRISRPGQRIYKGNKEIKSVRQGYGVSIISTSRGLMTDKEARKNKLGGEVFCEIW